MYYYLNYKICKLKRTRDNVAKNGNLFSVSIQLQRGKGENVAKMENFPQFLSNCRG